MGFDGLYCITPKKALGENVAVSKKIVKDKKIEKKIPAKKEITTEKKKDNVESVSESELAKPAKWKEVVRDGRLRKNNHGNKKHSGPLSVLGNGRNKYKNGEFELDEQIDSWTSIPNTSIV